MVTTRSMSGIKKSNKRSFDPTPKTTSKKRKLNSSKMNSTDHDSTKPFFPDSKQFHQTCLSQRFSLPIPLMKYIWTNPSSPVAYQKLTQSCKLFFIKNPILVICNLKYGECWGYWTYCCAKKECCTQYCDAHKKLDMNKVKEKIWLTGMTRIRTENVSPFASNFISKIYQCNLERLSLDSQTLSYDELKFFPTGVKHCSISWCVIKYNNGELVPLEEIVKLFSISTDLFINFQNNDSNIAFNNYKDIIAACKYIKNVRLYCPDEFDVTEFYQQLKKNKCRTLFLVSASNNENRVGKIIDDILQIGASDTIDYIPPEIFYSGISAVIGDKVEQIQKTVAERYF